MGQDWRVRRSAAQASRSPDGLLVVYARNGGRIERECALLLPAIELAIRGRRCIVNLAAR